jgi:Ca-activated chloride channel homolog
VALTLRITLVSVVIAFMAGGSLAQSGRSKPTPTPTPPRTITGPSGLSRPTPTPAPAQRPSPTPSSSDDEIIRISSVLVPIPVSVTDQNGKAVTNLRAADLELRIDGVAVPIDEISSAETPLRLAMLFDNSSSVAIARDFERSAAIRFFRRVIRPDRDLAALFSVNDRTRLEQSLTTDVGLLVKAIEALPQPKGATALLDGIIRTAEYLRSATGRRVIVIVSDGEDTFSDAKTTLEETVRQLLANDCQVYVVNTKEFENFKRTGSRRGNANIRSLTAERRMGEITMQTGGAVHSPIDEGELRAAFDLIAADLSQQYVINYYPDNDDGRRGEFRTISVTVKGRPELTVRMRKGYYVGR